MKICKTYMFMAVAAAVAVMGSSCEKNKAAEPTTDTVEAPHWTADAGHVAQCPWHRMGRDDEPTFMTMTALIPTWDDYTGYDADHMAVLDANDSVIGLTQPDRSLDGQPLATMLVLAPSILDNSTFRPCFHSASERQYYSVCTVDEDPSSLRFEHLGNIGSVSEPQAYGWHPSGRFTRLARLDVSIPEHRWVAGDEVAVWVDGGCRAAAALTPGETAETSVYVPVETVGETVAEVRIYRAETKRIILCRVILNPDRVAVAKIE